jgi:hypothetical protein
MKITKNVLRQIIREEVAKLSEQSEDKEQESGMKKLQKAAELAGLSFELRDGGSPGLESQGKALSNAATLVKASEEPLAAAYDQIGQLMVDLAEANYILSDFLSPEMEGSNIEQLSDAAKHLESAARHAREALAKSK